MAWPGMIFSGQLTRLFDMVDEHTRTINGRVEVNNPEGKLKPNMFVNVAFKTPVVLNTLAVAVDALQMEGNSRYVFVAGNDSTFEKRMIEPGRQFDNWVEICGGLKAGDVVVTNGAFVLTSELGKSLFEEE
jgi:membrane fusion protein, copper/silver efflux system